VTRISGKPGLAEAVRRELLRFANELLRAVAAGRTQARGHRISFNAEDVAQALLRRS
jgi:hypothetical protein